MNYPDISSKSVFVIMLKKKCHMYSLCLFFLCLSSITSKNWQLPLVIMQTWTLVLFYRFMNWTPKLKITSFRSSTDSALFAFWHRSAQELDKCSIQSAFMYCCTMLCIEKCVIPLQSPKKKVIETMIIVFI